MDSEYLSTEQIERWLDDCAKRHGYKDAADFKIRFKTDWESRVYNDSHLPIDFLSFCGLLPLDHPLYEKIW